jgi:undecaprenyl-diphosphatase
MKCLFFKNLSLKEKLFYNKSLQKYFLKEITLIFFLFLLFIFLAFNVVAHNLDGFDIFLTNAFFNVRLNLPLYIDKIALFFTILGNWEVVFVLFLTFLIYLLFWRRIRELIFVFLALLLGILFNFSFKFVIQRPRPEISYALLNQEGFSFPSGHSLLAFVFYGFLSYLLFKEVKKKWIKFLVFLLGILIIGGIGFSRFYLGVHWFSDILGGWFLGFIVLAFVLTLMEKAEKEKFIKSSNLLPNLLSQRNTYLFVFTVISLFFVLFFYENSLYVLKDKRVENLDNVEVVLKENEEIEKLKENEEIEKLLPNFSELWKGVKLLTTQEKYPLSLVILIKEDEIKKLFEKVGWKEKRFSLFGDLLMESFGEEKSILLPLYLNKKAPLFIFEKDNCNEKKSCFVYLWKTNFAFEDKKVFVVALWANNLFSGYKNKISFLDDLVVSDLSKTGFIAQIKDIKISSPYIFDVYGNKFIYDGRIYFLKVD